LRGIQPVFCLKDGLFYWMTRVMARRLMLIRHAAPSGGGGDRLLGSTDLPLGPEGITQARALAPALRRRGPAACYCSPLLRARQTADCLIPETPLIVQTDEDLREIDFGLWEGRTFSEIAVENPAAVARWAQFCEDFVFPEGDSIGDFLTRVRRVADRLVHDGADSVLVVTHGGVIRAMICHLLGLPPRQYVLFNIRCATCTTIDLFDGKGVLTGLNESFAGGGG
jgi:alpha-ribazole phosphatase